MKSESVKAFFRASSFSSLNRLFRMVAPSTYIFLLDAGHVATTSLHGPYASA